MGTNRNSELSSSTKTQLRSRKGEWLKENNMARIVIKKYWGI